MTSDDLQPAQAHHVMATVAGQRRYLNRLCQRMNRLGFPPTDPLWIAAHYAACQHGVGR